MSETISTPVTLPTSWGGLASSLGVLRFDGQYLHLEFETKDGVLEVLRSGVQKVVLPLSALESLVWKAGWFGGVLELTTDSLALLETVPGSAQGRVRLKIDRQDRPSAARLADAVQLAQAYALAHRSEGVESVR